MRRTPPGANHALQAAWQNFSSAETGAPQVPALLLMADALQVLNRPAQAIQALEAAAERAPDNKTIVQKLDEAQPGGPTALSRVAARAPPGTRATMPAGDAHVSGPTSARCGLRRSNRASAAFVGGPDENTAARPGCTG